VNAGAARSIQKRDLVRYIWVGVSLGYAALRILLAQEFLAEHGLNIWAFAIVELVSTVPWAVGSARAVTALIDKNSRRATGWAAVASAGFLAPEVFVLIATDRPPKWLPWVLALWVGVAGLLAVRRIIREVRQRRDARRDVVDGG
jgi:hypothetical protein